MAEIAAAITLARTTATPPGSFLRQVRWKGWKTTVAKRHNLPIRGNRSRHPVDPAEALSSTA